MRSNHIQHGDPVFTQIAIPGSSAEIKIEYRMTDAEFWKFCTDNPDLRIELDKNKTLSIMPPV